MAINKGSERKFANVPVCLCKGQYDDEKVDTSFCCDAMAVRGDTICRQRWISKDIGYNPRFPFDNLTCLCNNVGVALILPLFTPTI